jgi:hypothetical protein
MTLSAIDCFYIIMFFIVFGFIIHIETNIKILLEMMKEHVKCESIKDSLKHSKNPLE